MGDVILCICAGIIASGLTFGFVLLNQVEDWDAEEYEMTEEDLRNEGYQDLW